MSKSPDATSTPRTLSRPEAANCSISNLTASLSGSCCALAGNDTQSSQIRLSKIPFVMFDACPYPVGYPERAGAATELVLMAGLTDTTGPVTHDTSPEFNQREVG
jgi:hypothetical protein